MTESKEDTGVPDGFVLIRKKDGNPFLIPVDSVRYLDGSEERTLIGFTDTGGVETLESVRDVGAKIYAAQERVRIRRATAIAAAGQTVIDTLNTAIKQAEPLIAELKAIK
jgi:hypothetical protein